MDSRINIVKQLLSVVEKYTDYYYTGVEVKYLTNRYTRDKGFSDITNITNGIKIRYHTSDVCDYVEGEHVMNNTYRPYPSYLLLKGIINIINDISKISNEGEKKKASEQDYIKNLSSFLQIIHSRFFYHDFFNLSILRSKLLFQRAVHKRLLKDPSAINDVNEALKCNVNCIEGYLLRARIDYEEKKIPTVLIIFLEIINSH